ncbi:MAG: hypothetical protein FJ035_07480 [Chloroflexi bacterium]|nr:hypothetical protein [Chloroflexota bacterium]
MPAWRGSVDAVYEPPRHRRCVGARRDRRAAIVAYGTLRERPHANRARACDVPTRCVAALRRIGKPGARGNGACLCVSDGSACCSRWPRSPARATATTGTRRPETARRQQLWPRRRPRPRPRARPRRRPAARPRPPRAPRRGA